MKILIVDDEPGSRNFLRKTVEHYGHEAVEAGDGQEGLRMASKHKPDAIISDALMPNMDGFQFLRAVRLDKTLSSIPFVFYTGIYTDDKEYELAVSLGADALIVKPKDPADFWKEFTSALDAHASKNKQAASARLTEKDEDLFREYCRIVAARLEEKVREQTETLQLYQRTENDLRNTEKALKTTSNEWRRTFDAINSAIVLIDKDGKIVRCNKVMSELIGKDFFEIVGRHCRDVIPGTSVPLDYCLHEIMKTTLKRKTIVTDHGDRWFEVAADPFFDSEGNLLGAVHIITDITEQKNNQDKLFQSEQRYRNLVDSAQDVIFTLGIDGAILSLNPVFETITGWSMAEIIGQKFAKFVHPDDLGIATDNFLRVMRGESPTPYLLRILHKSGSDLYGEFLVRPDLQDGVIVGVFGIARDITKRKRAEDGLREAIVKAEDEKARADSIIAAIGDGITIHDRDFRILYQNQAMKNMIGDHVGEFCYMAYEKREQRCEGCGVAQVFKNGEVHTVIRSAPTDRGILHVEITASPLRDSKGNIIAGIEVVHDITNRKKIEEALERQKQFTENLIQNSAVATFVLDSKHKVLIWNKACEELTGMPSLVMVGTGDQWRPFYPQQRPVLADIILDGNVEMMSSLYSLYSKSVLIPEGLHAEGWYLNMNGKDRYVVFEAAPVYNSAGLIIAAIETLQDITERKIAEETIITNEERYRNMFDNALDMIQSVAPDGHFIYVNPAWQKTLGYNQQDLEKLTLFDILDESCKPQCRTLFASAMSGKPNEFFETSFISKEGRLIKIEGSSSVNVVDGNVVSTQCILRDVTERKKLEEQLSQITKEWEETFNTITDMVTVHDKDFNIIRANKAAEKILGLPFLELKTVKCFEYYHGTGCPPEGCQSCQSLETGKPSISEMYEPHLKMFIEINAIPRIDIDNKVVGLIHVVRDITERKKAEDLLKEEKNRAQKYLDIAGVMFVALDSSGTITLINKKGLDILGYEEDEVIDHNWFELCIPGHVRKEVEGVFSKLMAGDIKLVEYYENPVVIKDGDERLIAFHNTVLQKDSGEIYGILFSGEDITERKQAQDELNERAQQAALGAEIGVAFTTGGDLRATLQLCAEAMVQHLDAAFARIWTLNEGEQLLEMQASAGIYTHINGVHGRVPVGKFKIGLIAEERKPHLTNQVIGDPRVGDQEWAIKEGMVAFAGYPLIVQNRLVGVMALFSRRQIPEATMSSLAAVADVIALGIERKTSEEALTLYSRELTALSAASDTLMLITSLDDIYQEICNIIYKVFKLKMVWLGIVEEGSFKVKPVAFAGFEDGYLSKIRVTWDDSPTGMGPTGTAIKTGKPVKTIITEPKFALWMTEALNRGYVESVAVPLIYARDKCVGTLNFYSDNTTYFAQDRIRLFQIFANQAAIAIENAQLVSGLEVEVHKRTQALEDTNMELRQLNTELELRREEAEAANRSKSEFLSNMSHELRTPLNAIMGFSDIMQTGMAGPVTDKQKEFLNDIYTSGEHLLALITDILDLSKIEAGKIELETSTFTLKELIDSSLMMFKEKASKHAIKVTTEIDDVTTEITADQKKLKQVFVNLLGNAFKFTSDGGSVRVTARKVRSQEFGVGSKEEVSDLQTPDSTLPEGARSELITQYSGLDTDFIEISVADTGIGISAENLHKLFQPFQQIETSLTRKYSGTGLGLSLCRRFVELHGGRIWAESEFGKGSRFVFILPVTQ